MQGVCGKRLNGLKLSIPCECVKLAAGTSPSTGSHSDGTLPGVEKIEKNVGNRTK